ncbi:hypothetical protein C5167_041481, partial [Papaver somniferum]
LRPYLSSISPLRNEQFACTTNCTSPHSEIEARDVRMAKNIRIDVTEENRAKASATAKTMNELLFKRIGRPLTVFLLASL